MARVKINLPEKFLFTTEIPIMLKDMNRGNHLSFDSVPSMMEEARIRFLDSTGYNLENMGGAYFITTDIAVIYKRQGFYGQTLKFELAVTDFTSRGCDFVYRISNIDIGEEVARAKMGVVFFDYKRQKVVPVPENFRKQFDI